MSEPVNEPVNEPVGEAVGGPGSERAGGPVTGAPGPVRYRVTHRTTYSYDEPVTDSLGVAHLRPRDLPWQQVAGFDLVVDPAPVTVSHDVDHHGNTATWFQVTEAHTTLDVTAVSDVTVSAPTYDEQALAVPWERARPLVHPTLPGAWRATDHALASPLVEHTPGARDYARASLLPGRPLGEAVRDLVARVHADLAYDGTATTVTSTVDDVLAARAGVCQDFAHLTLACLRSHGLAARYVSGYLATTPPPGRDRVVGADASHAWVAVWVPAGVPGSGGSGGSGGAGAAGEGQWLALDPTNDQQVGAGHVTVAWGRDYADVPPVKGVIFTEAGRSTLRVSVDVAPG